jgi:hypothetical protein
LSAAPGLRAAQPLFDSGIEQVMVLHPLGQQLQTKCELASPRPMLIELLVE